MKNSIIMLDITCRPKIHSCYSHDLIRLDGGNYSIFEHMFVLHLHGYGILLSSSDKKMADD